MNSRYGSWSVMACSVLVLGTLLACKKKKTEAAPDPGAAAATATAPAVVAPTAPTAEASPAKTFNVGEAAETSQYKLTIENVKECKPGPYLKPTKGNIWLGIEITLAATGDKQVYPSSTNMKVVDGEGNVLKHAFASGAKSCEPTLGYQALNNGEKTKGWVVFEVPTGATGLKFTYQPIGYPPPPVVKFDLGR